jgi:hypothetical protein
MTENVLQRGEFVVKTPTGRLVFCPCQMCGGEAQIFVYRDGRLIGLCYRCAVVLKEVK